VVVAGDVDHRALVGLVRKAYGGWKRGGASVEIPAEPPQRGAREATLKWPLPTLPVLYFGYHIPASDPKGEDTAALAVLAEAVFGETSPLYKALVIGEQKVVLLRAEAEAKRDPGLFTVVARVRSPGDVADVRLRIESALAQAADEPINDTRLHAIQSHLRYAFAGSLDDADAVARAVGEAVAVDGRPGAINERYAAYDDVTTADLRRVAARYFARSNQTLVTLESEAHR
jgi:zinc protease